MKAKKRFLSLLLCGAMLFSLCPQATFAEGVEAGGLCEHHPQHTAECGYTEGSEGTPCSHEHTEDCYILATQCVHEHGPECYPQESVEPAETEGATDDAATPSGPEEQEPTERAVWAATRLAAILRPPRALLAPMSARFATRRTAASRRKPSQWESASAPSFAPARMSMLNARSAESRART